MRMNFKLTRSTDVTWGIYIAIFFLIYSSKDSCFFGVNINSAIKAIGYCITFAASIYLILKASISRILKTYSSYIVILSFLSLSTLAINNDISIKYFYEILLFLSCSAIAVLLPFNKFRLLYTDILFILSLCSLIIHFINILYPSIIEIFPLHHNEGGYPFRYCIFGVTTRPEYGLIRNWGIFREPGVYIFYLCLGLAFELFSSDTNFKKVICFILTVVTTLSTAGFIVAAGILLVYLIFSKRATKRQKRIFFVFLILGSIFIYLSGFIDLIYSSVFGKLFYENDSTASRFGSVATNINMWSDSIFAIILGQGYSFVETEFTKFQSIALGGQNNTNTAFKMLAVHGIIYTSLIYGLIYRFCIKNYKFLLGLSLFIFILMLQSNEDLIVSFHTYLLAFYALEKKSKFEIMH